LTDEEMVDIMARAAWAAHKNYMGDYWYHAAETYDQLSPGSRRDWIMYAKAALQALKDGGVI